MKHAIIILQKELDKLINSPTDITEKEKLEREVAGGLQNQINEIENALISLNMVTSQHEGDGLHRYNFEELWGGRTFIVKPMVMQDLANDDHFWTPRGGGGFISAQANKLRGKGWDNLIMLVLVKKEE